MSRILLIKEECHQLTREIESSQAWWDLRWGITHRMHHEVWIIAKNNFKCKI